MNIPFKSPITTMEVGEVQGVDIQRRCFPSGSLNGERKRKSRFGQPKDEELVKQFRDSSHLGSGVLNTCFAIVTRVHQGLRGYCHVALVICGRENVLPTLINSYELCSLQSVSSSALCSWIFASLRSISSYILCSLAGFILPSLFLF